MLTDIKQSRFSFCISTRCILLSHNIYFSVISYSQMPVPYIIPGELQSNSLNADRRVCIYYILFPKACKSPKTVYGRKFTASRAALRPSPALQLSPTVQRIVFVIECSQWQKQRFRYPAGSRTIPLLCTGGAHPGPAETECSPEAER